MVNSVLISAPVLSRSGYGDHSRSICRAFINAGYDVKIIPTGWGTTPNTALNGADPAHKILLDRLVPNQILENQRPDIFISITIPPGFQPVGKFNIGITAGIECTKMRPEWIEYCNQMDLIITTSNFSAEVFKINKYERRNKQTHQVEGYIELQKPIEVLFEGLDLSIFNRTNTAEKSISDVMQDLPTFNFLFCGHWLDGSLGHDRKDIGMLIKVFLDTFKRKARHNQPGLVLKTGLAGFSIMERDAIRDRIQQVVEIIRSEGWKADLPPIYILNGELTDQEMNSLYNHPKIKAMVSFTHGEGFGRPLLEFTTTGKPVIAPNWSGQVDFLHPEFSFLLPGKVIPVDRSAQNEWIIDGHWFQVDYGVAANVLLNCHARYDQFLEKSRNHRKFSMDNFSEQRMQEKLVEIVKKYTLGKEEEPSEKKLVLPKLKKIT